MEPELVALLEMARNGGVEEKLILADWFEENGWHTDAAVIRIHASRKTLLVFNRAMTFAWVPPGQSWLGGGAGKPGEKEFTLEKDVWCGIYPVTQDQWQGVMGSYPSQFRRYPDNPVESVSWDGVQEFLKRANSRVGDQGYSLRLPTEEEWEYICRGGPIFQADSAFDFYFATSKIDLTPVRSNDLSSYQANFDGNYPAGNAGYGPRIGAAGMVGSYPPNPLGIYDLHGNVWEWTSSIYEDGRSSRIVRGGGWDDNGRYCAAAYRCGNDPGHRRNDVGFRVIAVPIEE